MNKNALTVLKERYLWHKKSGKQETPEELFRRVARAVSPRNLAWQKKFLKAMQAGEFLPNSPTLMNAGKNNGQLAACFVLPLEDDLSQIMDTLKLTALIHQSGGGTGFSFSKLRPEGSSVHSSHGVATGPVGFLRLFNELTENIKQGGLRRGANMGVLSASHPDIEKFIRCKQDTSHITNFNISVGCSDKFMKAVKAGSDWKLQSPHRAGPGGGARSKNRTIKAAQLFEELCTAAWQTGEPGLIFLDAINRTNPTPFLGPMESTNPCGEQPLLPYEACNLGSINLKTVLKPKSISKVSNVFEVGSFDIDWNKLSELTELGVLFLNGVIDACIYPNEKITELCQANRKIGLGVMGFADLLLGLGVTYGSPESLKLADKIMGFIREHAILTSQQLAKKSGGFDGFSKSLWKKKGFKPLRNATLTTVAPTGTISIIADCTPGIEPVFNYVYERHVTDGKILREVHSEFAKLGLSTADIAQVSREGTLKNLKFSSKASEAAKKIFVTARDVAPLDHVRMQAEFQKHSDSAVSKTINLDHTTHVSDVKAAFLLAYDLGCKGITVYRDGSRPDQVMQFGAETCPDCD